MFSFQAKKVLPPQLGHITTRSVTFGCDGVQIARLLNGSVIVGDFGMFGYIDGNSTVMYAEGGPMY